MDQGECDITVCTHEAIATLSTQRTMTSMMSLDDSLNMKLIEELSPEDYEFLIVGHGDPETEEEKILRML